MTHSPTVNNTYDYVTQNEYVLLKEANYQADIPSHHRLICHSKQSYQKQGVSTHQQLSAHSSPPPGIPTS